MTRLHESLAGSPQPLSQSQADERLDTAFRDPASVRQTPVFGQIVAGLVRRFRNPISSIEGASWLLEDTHLPKEKHEEFVRIIRTESHRLDRALSDIQEFTLPLKPRITKVDLSNLLDEVIQLAGPGEYRNFFLFRKDMAPGLPAVHCDPELITKMLLNLAMNAIQATPEGGQLIWKVCALDGQVAISIRDFGRGIPPGIVGRVFDPFFTTRESGLGLGLTVARQIAVAHGGSIQVETIVDRGASISVLLPLNPPSPR